MCKYTYIHKYIYTYIHIYIYTDIQIYIYTYICIYIYTHSAKSLVSSMISHTIAASAMKSLIRILHIYIYICIYRDFSPHSEVMRSRALGLDADSSGFPERVPEGALEQRIAGYSNVAISFWGFSRIVVSSCTHF